MTTIPTRSAHRPPIPSIAAAYSVAARRWAGGPERVYGPLARELVARCPGGVRHRRVLDLGAGTGVVSQVAVAEGAASVVGLDLAWGMVTYDASSRPPAVQGDLRSLPFGAGSFGAVLAAFSLNHVADPVAALREACRVLARGGGLIASAYATDDDHPVKRAADDACRAAGWQPDAWYLELRGGAMTALSSTERAMQAAALASMPGAGADVVRVPMPGLTPMDLVAWRLGMAHLAPFIAALSNVERRRLVTDALARLGRRPPLLVRSMVVLSWTRPR